MKFSYLPFFSLLFGCTLIASPVYAQDCAAGKTLTEGRLTIATGNPAYAPWVMDDDPASGKGFEAATAYAVAAAMGFKSDAVDWVRTSFDEAIQPGVKDFDFNIQQYSINSDRDKVIDFSEPYYTTAVAVVVKSGSSAETTEPTGSALRKLRFGAAAGTTSQTFLSEVLKPEQDLLIYDDNADVIAAISANQIDALVFDLPSALFATAVQIDGGKILGQFPVEASIEPDNFGLLMAEGNPLKSCVDEAIEKIRGDNTLSEIESTWLGDGAGVPVIDLAN
ncbi:ABC transporter substrate-binding protein [Chromatiales bacterium (ex Bugula neritina AB1)]|nr:ABC transporter substrate-binding protein [Chromatiales bacterium (ex Bugula neritina AB1)]